MNQNSLWSSSIFIIALVAAIALLGFGILSFFMVAKSVAIVDQATRVFGDILLAALGAKAGLSVPMNGLNGHSPNNNNKEGDSPKS